MAAAKPSLVSNAVNERVHLDEYARQLMDPTTGIALSTKRVRMHTYTDVFCGTDAAGWFLANMEGVVDLASAQQVDNMHFNALGLSLLSNLTFACDRWGSSCWI